MITLVRGCLFDVDGLTLATEDVIDHVAQEYAKYKTGAEIPQDRFLSLRAKMFGGTPQKSAVLLHEELGLPIETADEYLEWRKPVANRLFAQSELLPGARELIEHLANHEVPIAIGTSTPRDLLALKFTRHPYILELFDGNIVTSDEAPEGKAAIFLAAAQKLGLEPASCLVFEDAPSGVEGAKEIGAHVVCVPHPLLDRTLVASADQVLDSLADFKPEEWGLPPY